MPLALAERALDISERLDFGIVVASRAMKRGLGPRVAQEFGQSVDADRKRDERARTREQGRKKNATNVVQIPRRSA